MTFNLRHFIATISQQPAGFFLCMSSVTCQADGVASGQINGRNCTEEEGKEGRGRRKIFLTKGRVVSGTQRAEMPLPITIVRKDRRQQSAAWQLNKRPIRSWHGTKIRRVCVGGEGAFIKLRNIQAPLCVSNIHWRYFFSCLRLAWPSWICQIHQSINQSLASTIKGEKKYYITKFKRHSGEGLFIAAEEN